MEDLWSIVEFEDGMEMIPTSWIMQDKSAAYWPKFSSHKFMKAVKNRIPYENEWSLFKIKKILASSNSYDNGLLKLKKAEILSDINSENDDLEAFKKSRKERAKIIISSSEDNNSDQENIQLPHYPKVPQIKSNSFNTKSKNKCDDKSKKQLIKEAVNTFKENKLKSKNTITREINKNDNDFISDTCNEDKSEPCAIANNISLTSHDLQRYIIRKILDIGYQLNSLTEQGNIINNKLDTIIQNLQISFSHGIESETLEQDIMNKFPIENIEDLQNFEKSLIAGQINRQKLIKELSRIGGNDIKRIVFNLLRTVMSDKLACMFNYIGGKKKRIFYDLELRKVIFSVVRVHFTNATEQIIAEPIKSWLRHANERYQKKTKDNTDRHTTTTTNIDDTVA